MSLSLKRKPRYRPRLPRFATSVTTAILLPDDREIPIAIRNMSTGGFMAVTDAHVQVEMWLGVELPGRGIRRAQIRWFQDGMLGARFEVPLTLEEIEAP